MTTVIWSSKLFIKGQENKADCYQLGRKTIVTSTTCIVGVIGVMFTMIDNRNTRQIILSSSSCETASRFCDYNARSFHIESFRLCFNPAHHRKLRDSRHHALFSLARRAIVMPLKCTLTDRYIRANI